MNMREALAIALDWYDSGCEDRKEFKQTMTILLKDTWRSACEQQKQKDAEICQSNKYEDGSQYNLEDCEKTINWCLDKTANAILNQGDK